MNNAQTIVAWAQAELQDQYLDLLAARGGEFLSNRVLLYGVDDLIERNETYQSKEYCPGFIAIGDDGGGRMIVIALGSEPSPVYIADMGSMDEEYFDQIATDLASWLAGGAPVD